MTLGAFACVLAMRRPQGMVEEIDELAGLAETNLGMATVLAHVDVLAGRHPAAGRLLRQVLRVRRRREGRGCGRLPCSACSPAWSAPTTTCASSRSCSSTSRRRSSSPFPSRQALVMGLAGLFVLLYVVWPAPLVAGADAAAEELCFRTRAVGRPVASSALLSQRHSRGSRLHQHGSVQARAGRRGRAPVGHGAAPDAGAGAVGPPVGLRARQSLRQPAAAARLSADGRAPALPAGRRGGGGGHRARRPALRSPACA